MASELNFQAFVPTVPKPILTARFTYMGLVMCSLDVARFRAGGGGCTFLWNHGSHEANYTVIFSPCHVNFRSHVTFAFISIRLFDMRRFLSYLGQAALLWLVFAWFSVISPGRHLCPSPEVANDNHSASLCQTEPSISERSRVWIVLATAFLVGFRQLASWKCWYSVLADHGPFHALCMPSSTPHNLCKDKYSFHPFCALIPVMDTAFPETGNYNRVNLSQLSPSFKYFKMQDKINHCPMPLFASKIICLEWLRIPILCRRLLYSDMVKSEFTLSYSPFLY
jgi:hypothetical protein